MSYLPLATDGISRLAAAEHVEAKTSLGLAERIREEGYEAPEGEELLPDWTFRFRNFSVDAATELGLFFGSTEAKSLRRLVVYEWLKYRDIEEGDQKVRWGVAIRVRLNVKKLSARAEISNIFSLAASAHANLVNTTAEIENLGVSSAEVEAAIPVINALTMESFVELQHAYTEALPVLTRGKDVDFTPRIVAIWGETLDEKSNESSYREALAMGWALTKIVAGDELDEALERGTEAFREIVRDVYAEFADIFPGGDKQTPSPVDKARAAEILAGLKVED